jgi:O-antigen ligase
LTRIPEYLLMLYSLAGTISITVSHVVMGLAALVTVADRGRRTRFVWRRTGLEAGLLAWALASVLSAALAADPVASLGKLKKLLLFGMVYWAPGVIEAPWNLGRLFMGLLFAAGATSLYGVLTFFLRGGEAPIAGFHGFYLTNSGLLLLCTFPAILFAACRRLSASHRLGAAIAGVSILSAQFFGCLPGAWLGTGSGLLFLAFRRRKPLLALAVPLGALLLALIPGEFQKTTRNLLDPDSGPNRARLLVWRNGLALFAEDPVSGWGLHDLRDEYARVMDGPEAPQGHMHSVPVHVAAAMGVPGLAALGWLLAATFRALARARAATEAKGFPRAVVDGAEAGTVGFLAAGLVEWNLGDSEILALWCFLIGTAICAGRIGRAAPGPAGR